MKEIVRTGLEYEFNRNDMLKRLHCTENDEPYERAKALADDAKAALRPAFAIKEFTVDEVRKDGVVIGGRPFHSRIVAEKLKNEKNVYVYIATCGRKINELIDAADDALDKYILDQFAYLAYLQAMEQMSVTVEEQFGIARHIRLCPGSIIDWSIGEVCEIFTLMEGLYQRLDVNVLESGLINPLKSTSGMFYPTEEEFESCAICPRANCENRKMPFNEELHDKMVNL